MVYPCALIQLSSSFCLALSNLAIEVKLGVLFILLENLKHTFAEARGYPFIKGNFRALGATPANPGKKWSFKELLTEMLAAVNGIPDRRFESFVDLFSGVGIHQLCFITGGMERTEAGRQSDLTLIENAGQTWVTTYENGNASGGSALDV